jgi:ubiquinone/menaquinone biosynthesis C-methylase UbiE
MSDTTTTARAHYAADGLTGRLAASLAAIAPEDAVLSVQQLAPLDQFHTRGLQATMDLATLAGIGPKTRVLDIGSGLGGPARYLAATFGCRVHGVDLSPDFVEAATYLTARCGLSDLVTFQAGDALDLPAEDGAFDAVLLQHVAMNIADRAGLYAQARRVLALGGRLATFDIVSRAGDLHFPVPWARQAIGSHLLTEDETRLALEAAGFISLEWRDDTATAQAWLAALAAGGGPPRGPLSLGLVMGPDFPMLAGNLARNIAEGRAGVLMAVLERPAS